MSIMPFFSGLKHKTLLVEYCCHCSANVKAFTRRGEIKAQTRTQPCYILSYLSIFTSIHLSSCLSV